MSGSETPYGDRKLARAEETIGHLREQLERLEGRNRFIEELHVSRAPVKVCADLVALVDNAKPGVTPSAAWWRDFYAITDSAREIIA